MGGEKRLKIRRSRENEEEEEAGKRLSLARQGEGRSETGWQRLRSAARGGQPMYKHQASRE